MNQNESSAVLRIRRLLKVTDPCGLHLRPAALLAKTVGLFDADVVIEHGSRKVSGKSPLSLLTLCVGPGGVLDIVAEGTDALQTMETLVGIGRENGFLAIV